jgi:REP element-mobilizing transposase RayT
MPQVVLDKWEAELSLLPQTARNLERRKRMEAYLDAGHGQCWLRQTEIARMVQAALLHFDGSRYRLICWSVMPNHAHFIIETAEKWTISKLLYDLKSFTAKQANKLLQRVGRFWQRDYYDRYIRDGEHLATVTRYIEENPVKARLVAEAKAWLWGSARLRRDEVQ